MLTKPWRARKTSRAISEGAKAAAIDVAATHMHPRTKKILFPHTSPSFPHNLEFRVSIRLQISKWRWYLVVFLTLHLEGQGQENGRGDGAPILRTLGSSRVSKKRQKRPIVGVFLEY